MSGAVAFTVPGEARAWARAGVRVVQGHAHHFMDRQTRSYEGAVKMVAAQAMRGRVLFEEPVRLDIVIRRSPPLSASRKKAADMLAGVIRPGTKPDCSNILKGIEDALNGVVYRDDALIAELHVRKIYAATPGVDVRIEPLAPQPSEVGHD